MPQTQPNLQLNQIQRSVLDHLKRYRLTTMAALKRVPDLARIRISQLKRNVRALKDHGLIAEAPLFGQAKYLHLAATDSNSQSGPHSEKSKIRNYAMLSFCCLGSNPRERLTANDFQTHFPDLYRFGLPLTYYVDLKTGTRMGFMRVDAGGRGRWDNVVARIRDDVQRHILQPGFRPLIEHDQFEVAVLTARPEKAQRIRDALEDSDDVAAGLVQVSAIPELLNLIAPPPD